MLKIHLELTNTVSTYVTNWKVVYYKIRLYSNIIDGFSFMFLLPDINECDIGTHACNIFASCSNIAGSFKCFCNQGFMGDGMICEGNVLFVDCFL